MIIRLQFTNVGKFFRAVLQQSRVLEALLRAEPFPTAPVRYRRPPIGDA